MSSEIHFAALERSDGRYLCVRGQRTHEADAVRDMPVVILGDMVAGFETRIHLRNGEQAVDLVGHRGSENGLLRPHDGGREVVVLRSVIDPDETHALCLVLVSWRFCTHGWIKDLVLLGIRAFHLFMVSLVKNSELFMGQYDKSFWKVVIFCETSESVSRKSKRSQRERRESTTYNAAT